MTGDRPLTFAERLLLLESNSQRDEATRADVEERLRKLERAVYFGIGGLAVLQLVLKFIP